MQTSFGPGVAWGERTDITGSGIGPVPFALMQDLQLDCDFTTKGLYGQNQFAAVIARGQAKVTGKIKMGQIIAENYSDMVWGESSTLGQFGVAQDEPQTVPASTPFMVTVDNAASFNNNPSGDLGVRYAATGALFKRVTTPAAAGQYSVNPATGVYTFDSADASAAVLISYAYGNNSSGSLVTMQNQLAGTTPYFRFTFFQKISPNVPGAALIQRPFAVRLNACTASKWSLPTKMDDFTIQEIDFEAFADAAGIVGYVSSVE